MSAQSFTKAETLKKLEKTLALSAVLPQKTITLKQWLDHGMDNFTSSPQPAWLFDNVIVRSSAVNEDTLSQSMAGHYKSMLDVRGKEQLETAINQIFNSMDRNNLLNQCLIQPVLTDTKVSGVAFTCDPNTGSPYYVINYDDETGSTYTVTSGMSNNLKTKYIAKCKEMKENDWKDNVIRSLREIEKVMSNCKLDVEFAVDADDKVYILQVRPLVNLPGSGISDELFFSCLDRVANKIDILATKHPYLFGDKGVFGNMPDWNPAEIIGVRPRPLALSLYKELITDNIWAYQRDNYGYKNLRSFPLLVDFEGLPYIDVRVSFNSFLPKGVSEDLSSRLINYYIDELSRHPQSHDKVEFDIIYSCYTFDLRERLEHLLDHGFSKEDCAQLEALLGDLTTHIINDNGHWKRDIEKIDRLEHKIDIIHNSDLDYISKIYWLIEDCKRYGTLPFAGLARAGFIAMQLLNSLVHVGIFSDECRSKFLRSVKTISSLMHNDFNIMSKEDFLQKYGHLRPGTYDICSERYDRNPDMYFSWDDHSERTNTDNYEFHLPYSSLKKMKEYLIAHNFSHDVVSFLNFMRSAIEAREYSKFIFTKSLSHCLSLIEDIGSSFSISTEDLAYMNIDVIRRLHSSSMDIKSAFINSIREGKEKYLKTSAIVLPQLITSKDSVYDFEIGVNEPNYITQKMTTAEVLIGCQDKSKLKNRIVMLPSADPGYDWIFPHGIAGLITAYGGINSHMAIRANELGIASVIGVGETLFKKWTKSKFLKIDCSNKTVSEIC